MAESTGLTQRRCRNHGQRAAVARCPACQGFFCRECITEHDGEIICASCLAKKTQPPAPDSKATLPLLRPAWRVTQFTFALILLWLAIYSFGQILINLPSDFHEGHFWDSEVTQ